MYSYLAFLGIIDGFQLLFLSIALSVLFRIEKTLNFGLAVAFTLGGYIAYEFSLLPGLPVWAAITIAVPIVALLGILLDFVTFWPLYKKNASVLVVMTTSLGVYFASSGILQLFWGTEVLVIQPGPSMTFQLAGFNITHIQLQNLAIYIMGSLLLYSAMVLTNFGRRIRAMGENTMLASALGFNVRKIRIASVALAYGTMGIAGALIGREYGVSANTGLSVFLSAAVVMIVGGLVSFWPIFIAAIGLGLVKNLSLGMISDQWQPTITFAILVSYILYSLSKIRYPDIVKR
jgi:branched-subunit amino acid ABC-type transport system permease component